MFKKVNYLLISCIVLIILIFIDIYVTKSSFTQNLKWNSGNVTINFKGFGKDSSSAQLNNVYVSSCNSIGSMCGWPTQSQDYNLIQVFNGSVINNYTLATSNNYSQSEGCIPAAHAPPDCTYGNYVNYTNIQTLPSIQVTDGHILFTNDITGTTSYKIQYGTVSDPSGINVDYGSNVITIDTSKGATNFTVDYVHNLVNNNGLPPGSILFQFPDNTGSGCGCTKITELSNAGNQIYKSAGNCTEGNNILIFPGKYGYDPNNPQIKCMLYMSVLGGCKLSSNGPTVDAGPWINDRIKEGYRKFILQEPYIGGCFYLIWANNKYASQIVATSNINGTPDTSTGNISSMSCT